MTVEESISQLLGRGDLAEAAHIAVQGYGPEILGYLVGVLGHEEDGRDVFAQFCEDLWRGLPQFRGDSSFRTWAYALASHAAHRFRRKRRRRPTLRIATSEMARIAQQVESSTMPRLRSAAAQLRAGLEPDEVALLALRIDRGMSWEDVAHVLSAGGDPVSSAAVRKRFERIKQRLARMAAEQGLRGR